MRSKVFFTVILAALVLVLVIPSVAPAEVVGRLTKVEGRVDLLKGGKLPATPVKVGDSVEAGDVLRCKSLSRAQITFMDASIVTLSPRSRLAIKDYYFEPAQHKRSAVLKLFQGLAHVVVNKLYKVKEPDFVIKTQTAVTGVRGTDFGVRIAPNSSTILNFAGKVRVASNFPEVGAALQRAEKIAFGSGSGSTLFPPGHFVDLGNMQGTTVQRDLPPTLPFSITSQDRKLFMDQLIGNFINRQSSSGSAGGTVAGTRTGTGNGGGFTVSSTEGTSSVPGVAPAGLVSGTGNAALALVNAVTVPPTVTPTTNPTSTPTPTTSTFTFTQQYYGSAWMIMSDSASQSSLQAYSLGQRTGVYAGYFSAVATGSGTASSASSPLVTNAANGSLGSPVATATGTVSGTLGQNLTGTMTLTNTAKTFSSTGTVTISPTGELTYNWTSTSGAIKSGTTTQTPGTLFTQGVSGNYTSTANLAGNQDVSTNSGELTGTQTMAGTTTNIKAGFSVTETKPNAGSVTSDSGTIAINSQGVLGTPDASGKQTGVMTGTAITNNGSTVTSGTFGGPVTAVPATSTTPQAMTGQVISADTNPQKTSIGVYAQTTDTGAQIVTQTSQGSYTASPTSPTTSTLNHVGWGASNTTGPGTTITKDTITTMTTTVTDATSGPDKPGIITQNAAAVVNPSTQTGPAQLAGVADNQTVFSATGTANTATGTTNFNGTYVGPDSRGTLTNGTLTTTTGTAVTVTPVSPGSIQVNVSSPVGNTQTTTFSGPVNSNIATYSGQGVGGNITSTTNNPSALPAAASTTANVNVQGVVNSSGAGAVTVTVNPTGTSPSPVSTYMGKASVDSYGNINAPNVVGKNPANPGVNKVPATQTGSVGTGPST